MKKHILLVLALSFLMMLAGCGTPSDSTPSNNNSDDKPSATVADSTPSNDTSTCGNSETDEFLKTITDETAEAKGVCGADLTWYYKDNVLVIKGTGEIPNYDSADDIPWADYQNLIAKVIIEDGCTNIPNYLFSEMPYLSTVILPNSIKTIGTAGFSVCHELVSVDLGKGLVDIDEFAFSSCEKLTDVVLPETVISIGDKAFSNCDALTSISIPLNVSIIGDNPFTGCKNLTSIICESPNFRLDDGFLIDVTNESIISCLMNKEGNIAIPDGIKSIGLYVFSDMNITSFEFPASLTNIAKLSVEKQIETITFKGNLPDGFDNTLDTIFIKPTATIYYSGTSFDDVIAEYPDLNWVKQ